MRTITVFASLVIVALAGQACNKNAAAPGKTSPKGSSTTPSVPAGQPPMKMVSNTGGGLSGAVTETMDAASYTYLKLKTAKGEVWAAVPKAKVTVGQTVTVVGAQMMSNFKSNTLKRTFASIYFGRLGKPGQAAPDNASAVHGAGGPAAKKVAAAHGKPKGKKQDVGVIVKAGYTIADVFAQRAKLATKKVTVRGKVIKFNANIMGKNWLHLQDGTGSEADKSFDLTVTTKGTAKVGDVVLVEGVLSVGKDFGAGYKYAAIVEDAKLSK